MHGIKHYAPIAVDSLSSAMNCLLLLLYCYHASCIHFLL